MHPRTVVFSPGHDDAIAGSDVVQEEIAERVKRFLAKAVWDRERAPIDLCARWRSGQGSDVTDRAADFVKKLGATYGFRGLREHRVSSGSLRGPNEASEAVYVRESIRTRLVVRFLHRVTEVGDFVRE